MEQSEKNKLAVLYCRVSTNRQAIRGSSLESQEKICSLYARQSGYEIAKIFLEEGESAKTADRTKLLELVDYCEHKRNRIEAVIFYKIDRWARYMLDYHNLKSSLNKLGISIKSATENLDDSPAGRFMENVLASQAQFDNEVRAERCAGGMKEAMRQGRYVWMAPIGYKNIKIADKATIGIDEKNGIMIRSVFDQVATGLFAIETVRKNITKSGLLNKQGKPLSKCYFYKLLTNPLYAGWIVKFGEKHKGLFAPLVKQDVFDLVQRVLRGKGTKHTVHKKDNPDFPLRRFIKNPNGEKLTGSWSKGAYKRYAYYRFGSKGLNIKKEKLEHAFVKYMNSFALKKYVLSQLEDEIQEAIALADAAHVKEREHMKKEIYKLEDQQNMLIQKNLKGVVSDEILSRQLSMIDTQLTKLNQLLIDTPATSIDIADAINFAMPYLKKPGEIWLKSSLETKIELQKFQFPNGIVFDGETFGTPAIPSIFNAKVCVLKQKSPNVDSRFQFWNFDPVEMKELRNEIYKLYNIIKQ